jgi:hypothetical protein
MPVYDDQKERTTNDDLNRITGINPDEEKEMERNAINDISSQEQGLYNPHDNEDEEGEDGESSSNDDSEDSGSEDKSEGKSKKKGHSANGSKAADGKSGNSNPLNTSILDGLKTKSKSFFKKKLAVAGLAGGIVGVGFVILLIIFFIGLFKIPHFGEHIAAYQFARVTRDMARNVDNVTATKMAIDSADDSTYGKIKAKYATGAGKADEQWSKLDKFRYQKMIDNMKRDDKLKFNYTKGTLLRPNGRLTSVVMADFRFDLAKPTLGSRLIPGVQFAHDVSFAQAFSPTLRGALAAEDIGPIVRGQIGRSLRQQLGIGLVAWNIGKYSAKTTEESKILIEQDARERIKGGSSVVNPKLTDGKINETAQQADAAEKAALDDPVKAAAIVADPNSVPPDVTKVLDTAFNENAMKSITGFLSPIYAIATPLCIVYDGSLVNSGPTINEQSAQSQRAFYMVMSASSQVKDGYQSSLNAAGAMGWKLGDIENSNPELRASGKPIDTTTAQSTQSSPTGQFSIVDAIIPPPFDSVLNNAAKTCPAFTNVWVGLGLGIANIAVILSTLGTASVPEAGADVAAQASLKVIAKAIIEKISIKKIAKDTVIQGGSTALATFIAKAIVLSQMGSAQSPLATGVPFANEADSGGNQQAQEMERQSLGGRPLSQDEVAMNNVADLQFLAAKTSKENVFDRYLSPSNADSLLTHVATMASMHLSVSKFGSLFNIGSSVLNPMNALASVASSMSSSRVGAAVTDTHNYGNVQSGYSTAEQAKLRIDPKTNQPHDPSYSLLENAKILDDSGKRDEIQTKYGPCFDPNMKPGDLLTEKASDGEYYIVRDKAGNVIPDQGLCSRTNLSFDNPGYGDLVFRWRVDNGYDSTMGLLGEEQTPVASESAASNPSPVGTGDGQWHWPPKTSFNSGPCWNKYVAGRGYHAGMDMNSDTVGNIALAAHDGTVATIAENPNGPAGYYITIKTDGPNPVYYSYEHLAQQPKFAVGAHVVGGQTEVGIIGKTGAIQGVKYGHLHMVVAVTNTLGQYSPASQVGSSTRDPMDYLPKPAPFGYVCEK